MNRLVMQSAPDFDDEGSGDVSFDEGPARPCVDCRRPTLGAKEARCVECEMSEVAA